MFEYEGYFLDGNSRYDLSNDDILLLDACIWLVDNRASIRVTAKNMGFSKSSFHRSIHRRLRRLSNELYGCVEKQIRVNALHRTSGRVW